MFKNLFRQFYEFGIPDKYFPSDVNCFVWQLVLKACAMNQNKTAHEQQGSQRLETDRLYQKY